MTLEDFLSLFAIQRQETASLEWLARIAISQRNKDLSAIRERWEQLFGESEEATRLGRDALNRSLIILKKKERQYLSKLVVKLIAEVAARSGMPELIAELKDKEPQVREWARSVSLTMFVEIYRELLGPLGPPEKRIQYS